MDHHDPMLPMLASPGPLPLQGDGTWAYEVKWDGMRVLGTSGHDGLRLTTRTGNDATGRLPEVAGAVLRGLPQGSVLDGEVVVLDDAGRPSFAMLAPRIQSRSGAPRVDRPATYIVFDLLRLGTEDLLDAPYSRRREMLRDLVEPGPRLVVGDAFDDGEALMRTTAEQGLEGVVAKRRVSRYQPGVRSRDWIKVPHRTSHSYVIGGWKSRSDSPGRLASILVGTPVRQGILRFDGAVGSGLSDAEARVLLEILLDTETTPDHCFEGAAPVTEPSDVLRWVEPIVAVDVAHLGRSAQGLLRQPTVTRLRPDLSFADVAAGVAS